MTCQINIIVVRKTPCDHTFDRVTCAVRAVGLFHNAVLFEHTIVNMRYIDCKHPMIFLLRPYYYDYSYDIDLMAPRKQHLSQ